MLFLTYCNNLTLKEVGWLARSLASSLFHQLLVWILTSHWRKYMYVDIIKYVLHYFYSFSLLNILQGLGGQNTCRVINGTSYLEWNFTDWHFVESLIPTNVIWTSFVINTCLPFYLTWLLKEMQTSVCVPWHMQHPPTMEGHYPIKFRQEFRCFISSQCENKM